jgi:HK97 family phage prohead protease
MANEMKESKMERKQKLAYAKSVDAELKTVTAYVSTYEWDRTLEKFAPGSWDLTNFKKNPVVLWGHDGHQPPIGRAVDIKEDANGLSAVTEFDTKSERGAEIFGLYERGFLNSFSVGFIPKNQTLELIPEQNTKGTVWTDAELLEYSAVSIPANPGAIVSREVAEMAIKCLGGGSITKSADGTTFLVNSPDLMVSQVPTIEKLGTSLEQLIALARIVKGQPMDKSKLSLVGTATNLLNELIAEHEEVAPEDIVKLNNVVKELASVVGSLNPDSEAIVKRTITNISKALFQK